MAYYDHMKAGHNQKCLESFEKLKDSIKDIRSEHYHAHEHIISMEQKLQQQKEKIEEYQQFFSMMNRLMPKQRSVNDVIG